ncbi:MAG: T9SS type A sorting domain-containing protein [Bacteroidia bacterium]
MKQIFSLSLLALLLSFGYSGKAQIAFSKEYGGVENEDGRWMEQMPDSGFILTGMTNTYSNGQADVWLVRTDAYGNTLWNKSFGGTQYDFGNMVKPTSDGGFVIAGFTGSYGRGGNDGWIIKTNASGIQTWAKTVGDTGLQELEAIVQTSDGGYAAVGINYTAGTQYYDIYLVRLDSNGDSLWTKNIGGQSYEIGNSIQQTADGGFIIGGQTYSYGNLDGDFYMVKTDANGNVQWQKTYANNGLQEAHYVQIAAGGGYVLVGDADSLANGLGDTDIWLIRTDANGDTLWTKVYGGTKKDGGKTIENTSDGGFVMAGITRSFNLINPNYYLIKTDVNGNVEWSNYSYGSAYHDHAYRGIETSDGGYAEFGYFRNASNKQNFALVKLGPGGGVSKDVAIDNFIEPLDKVCRSNNVQISMLLTNYGATNETNIPVIVKINDGTTTTTLQDTLTSALLPGTSAQLTFDQTYNFSATGTYTMSAYIIHRTNDISYTNDSSYLTVNVLAHTADPSTTSGVNCTNGSVTLAATPGSSADSLFWYNAPTGGNLVSTGSSYVTPSLNNSTTYYVEAFKGKGDLMEPHDNTIGGGGTSSNGYLKFDSRVNFRLISVKVYATSAGNRTIEFRNSGGTVLQSKTVNIPVGESRVYLDFSIPPGNDFQLGLGAGSGTLFRNNSGVAYPYDISRTLEIYGSSGGPNFYYYFYDWYVFVPYENCGTNRISAEAIIGTSGTTAFDKTRCGNGTVTLTANSSQTLEWYDAASGGTLLGTGSSYTTPSLNSTTTYYLQVGACSGRIPVQAIINSTSSAPTAPDVTNCGPGTVTLTATASDPVSWYDAASGGLLVGSGTTFTTPFLNTTTTYYAVAGTSCPSAAVPVQAIINSAASPTVSDVNACGPVSVTLTASSPDPVAWYSVPTGGTILATTYNFVTPVLSQPTIYYAEAVSACPSPRVAVTANITTVGTPTGVDASHCGPGSMVLSASAIDPVTWWDAATGGTQVASGINFTTPVLNTSTTYYAQSSNGSCVSARVPVLAEIVVTPPPTVTSGTHCGPGTVDLTASSPDPITWYDVASGGTALGTGTTFTTPSISVTTTYYAEAGTSCLSVRVPVDAVISSQAADPTVTDGSRCGTGTVDLSASSSDPVSWYDAPNGNLLGTGLNFTTPSISTTTIFYAVAGVTGCESNPVAVNAVVNTVPADPVVTGASNCGPAQLTLQASASDPMTWYDASSGGNIITTGTSYQDNFSSTTTYYVEASNGTCTSNRVPVTADIWTPPSINLGPDTLNIISGQTITLDAGAGYSAYSWSTTATTQTISVNATGTYSVVVTDAHSCQGTDSIFVNVITGVNAIAGNVSLVAYPNPSSGLIEIRVDNPSSVFDLKITNALGQLFFRDSHRVLTGYRKVVDLSSCAKGIYYLTLSTSNGSVTRQIILE